MIALSKPHLHKQCCASGVAGSPAPTPTPTLAHHLQPSLPATQHTKERVGQRAACIARYQTGLPAASRNACHAQRAPHAPAANAARKSATQRYGKALAVELCTCRLPSAHQHVAAAARAPLVLPPPPLAAHPHQRLQAMDLSVPLTRVKELVEPVNTCALRVPDADGPSARAKRRQRTGVMGRRVGGGWGVCEWGRHVHGGGVGRGASGPGVGASMGRVWGGCGGWVWAHAHQMMMVVSRAAQYMHIHKRRARHHLRATMHHNAPDRRVPLARPRPTCSRLGKATPPP